jgi:uncharacterized protein (TIGR00290 family)
VSSAPPRAWLAWSSGKDSAFALHEVRRSGRYDIVGALTTVTDTFGRVSMHGVREDVLAAQLAAIGLPGTSVRIPFPCPDGLYEQRMAAALGRARNEGVTHMVFGDLFLEDVRAYREARLAEVGMSGVFPLWGRPTGALARDIIASGLEARLVCVDLKALPAAFAGRRFDGNLLGELPPGTDPCGERGEFHTCVTGGPIFAQPLRVCGGEAVEREGYAFADLRLSA